MSGYDAQLQLRRPFATLARTPYMTGATLEGSAEMAFARALRALKQIEAEDLAELLPRNRSLYVARNCSSFVATIADLELTIGTCWLYIEREHDQWPQPYLVAGLLRGTPVHPWLAPTLEHAERAARALTVRRRVPPDKVLKVPLDDCRGGRYHDIEVPTLGEVLTEYSAIDDIVRDALGVRDPEPITA